MTYNEAPETIWASVSQGKTRTILTGHHDRPVTGWVEYTRADLSDAAIAAAVDEAVLKIVAQSLNYYTQGEAKRAVNTFGDAILAWHEDSDFTPDDARAALEAVKREARGDALTDAYNALFVVPAASQEQEQMAQRCQTVISALLKEDTDND